MESSGIILGILGALLLGAMSPGPSFVLVSRVAAGTSRRSGVAAAIGMGAGGVVFALLAVFGFIAILQRVEWLFLTLKVCGGIYLTYLGIKIFKHANAPLSSNVLLDASNQHSASQSLRSLELRCFRMGLLTQLANPKTAVVYTSIFAALLPSEPSQSLLYFLPVAVFFVEAGWYSTVALLLSMPVPKHAYLGGKKLLDRVAGTVLGLLGVRLIVEAGR